MLKSLFEPATLGNLHLPNRVVMTALHLGMADENGHITDRLIDFYVERARNLVGLIITGVSFFHPSGRGYLGLRDMIGIHDDDCLQGLTKLSRALKAHGSRLVIQLSHPGAHAYSKLTGVQAVSPSGLPSEITGEETHKLSLGDIDSLLDQFVQAAARARDAGIDAVEILCGKGLVGQFLSPLKNLRRDGFGGTLEGRMRFGLEILRRIKGKLGKDYPLIFRILGEDFYPATRTREEALVFSKALQDLGVDALDVTVESHAAVVPRDTMDVPPGVFLYLTQTVKSFVDVPVIGNIRLNDPFLAEEAIKSGKVDLVGIARGFLSDPELLLKAKEERPDQIRRCIGCCQGCLGMVLQGKPVSCLVNPQAGREGELRITPAARKKRVMVVGAGPAGMEAAWVLAQRGHDVFLLEEKEAVGGQLQVARVPPGRKDFGLCLEYLVKELTRLGVRIELNREVTAEHVLREKPQAVVLATGATALIPHIPGAEKNHVYTATAILAGQGVIGRQVIIIGGGSVGCETALHIAKMGLFTAQQMEFLAEWCILDYQAALKMALAQRSVTILEIQEVTGRDIELHTRVSIMASLARHQVKILNQAKVVEITDDGVYYLRQEKERVFLPGDTVVLAVGSRANEQLWEKFRGHIDEVYSVGDCRSPRTALEAIREGFEVGLKI